MNDTIQSQIEQMWTRYEYENALIDRDLGVSDDTILMRLGYDPDLEREKSQANADELASKLLENFDDGK